MTPGFAAVEDGKRVPDGPYTLWLDIYLDGERQTCVQMADVAKGVIRRFKMVGTRLVFVGNRRPVIEELHGQVEIRWKPDTPADVIEGYLASLEPGGSGGSG